MQEHYSQFNRDPNDVRLVPPGKPVRLWPYVLAGIIVAMLLWAYFEPITYHTTIEPIGPRSSLYGPMR